MDLFPCQLLEEEFIKGNEIGIRLRRLARKDIFLRLDLGYLGPGVKTFSFI